MPSTYSIARKRDAVNLIGIKGRDDVRMRQLRHRPDFPLEPAHGPRVIQPFLANDLDGDDAVEIALPRLEHLPHAALAEAFEENIRAKYEVAAAAMRYLIDLIGSDPAAFDQFLGQCPRLLKAHLKFARQLVELIRLQ